MHVTAAGALCLVFASSLATAQPRTEFPAGFSDRAKVWLQCAGRAKILGDPLASDLGFAPGGAAIKQKGFQTNEPPAKHFLQLADRGEDFVIVWGAVDGSLQIAQRVTATGQIVKTVVTTTGNRIADNAAYTNHFRQEVAFWVAKVDDVFAADPKLAACGAAQRGI